MPDILVTTDKDSILIDQYWIDIILAQTNKNLIPQELELEDIDNIYYMCEDFYMYLSFNKRDIREDSFTIFFTRCLQAYHNFLNSDDAKAYYVDWKKGTWRTRDSNRALLSDYLNPTIKEQLLALGNTEGYFNNTEEKNKDFQDYVDVVLLWWGRFLDFLKENYGKPKQEQNN